MSAEKLYEVWQNEGGIAICVSSFQRRDDAVRFLRAEATHGRSLRIRSPRGHWLDIGPDYVIAAPHNRRRSPRLPHNAYCEVELNPGRYAPDNRGRVLVPIRNVSREGIGLVTPQVDRSLLVNDRVLVVLEATQNMYRLPARIAWATATDVGIEIANHQPWVREDFAIWLNRSINV